MLVTRKVIDCDVAGSYPATEDAQVMAFDD
jgi:hypothetical protein